MASGKLSYFAWHGYVLSNLPYEWTCAPYGMDFAFAILVNTTSVSGFNARSICVFDPKTCILQSLKGCPARVDQVMNEVKTKRGNSIQWANPGGVTTLFNLSKTLLCMRVCLLCDPDSFRCHQRAVFWYRMRSQQRWAYMVNIQHAWQSWPIIYGVSALMPVTTLLKENSHCLNCT